MSPNQQVAFETQMRDERERAMMERMTPQEREAYNKQQNDLAIARANKVRQEMEYNERLRKEEYQLAADNQQGPPTTLAAGPGEPPIGATAPKTPDSAETRIATAAKGIEKNWPTSPAAKKPAVSPNDRSNYAPAVAAREARLAAERAGATPSEARRAAQSAYAESKTAMARGATAGFGRTGPGGPGTGFTGQPILYAGNGAVNAGSVRGSNIVATPEGPQIQGTSGQTIPFVEDPVTGNALPISNYFSQDEFIQNLDEQTRANALTVLSEGTDRVAQQFQQFDATMQAIDVDPSLSDRQKEMAKANLRKEQDKLLWSALRDPRQIMAGRTRMAQQQETAARQQQAKSQAMEERRLAAEQRRNAQIYERSYKQAEQELSSDPFNAATPEQVHARAMQIFRASGGAMPGTPSPSGSAGAAGAPGGMPTAGARTAPQSGAPDLSQMSIAVDPQSPIDFEMVAPNQMVTFLPDGSAMRAMNFNGRAVAVPANQAELDRLPPGSLYVLEGQVRRGEIKAPLRKEGETGKPSSASMESAQEEQFRIEEESKKVAGERNKGFEDYREQEAIYKEIDGEARRRAAQALGLNPDTDLVLTKNVRGEQEWEPPETLLKPTTKKMGEKGWSELTAWRDVDVLDPRGTWLAALERARKEVAEERFAGSTKPMPSWIVRGKGGAGISVVDKPTPPSGYDAKRDYTKPGAEDITEAERRYYGAKGTTKEAVQMERLLDEARKSTGAVEMDASGRQVVTVNGRRYPAVKVQVGGSSARLPAAMMREGQNPNAVAKEALSLLFSGKPFATVNREGKMIPTKFDPNHPMLKVMREYREKVGGDISAVSGAGQRNPGAAAAFAYVNEVFGYLPTESRKFILDNLLTNKRLGNNLGGYNFTG